MSKKSRKKDSADTTSQSVPFNRRLSIYALAVVHFVCPLLFFTNLTRNPYYTQIALLNITISILGLLWVWEVWRSGEWKIPRVSFEIPLLVFLVVALLSTLLSWSSHVMVREGIVYEGVRIWSFTLVNSCLAFYLPLVFTKPLMEKDPRISIWADIVFCAIWGGLWFGFYTMKSTDAAKIIWDPYGGFLWIVAFIYVVMRLRSGEAIRVFHVIFSVAVLAGAYGLLQYMGRDIIWSSPVQPYGGRPVSTFGNPNFLSSYLMMVCPVALAFGFYAKGKQAVGYFVVSAFCALSTLGTLTRSTYVGLFFALLFLAVVLYKKDQNRYLKIGLVAVGVLLVLIMVFPATPVRNIQSPLARFTEIFETLREGRPYAPWHQRILIWSCAWDMANEKILFGKGWGTFELFYPFYQGKYMLTDLFFRFRTHANNAHNILMEVWAQLGFLGTGTALWVMVTLFCGGWMIFKKKVEGLSRYAVAGLLASFVGLMMDNFFGNVSIFFAVPAFLFWWNMGALYNESGQITVQTKPVSPIRGRFLLVLFSAFCLFVIVYFVKRWNQEVYYFQGFKAAKRGQVEKSYKLLEKAFGWFKGEVNSNYELGNSYARYAQVLAEKKLNEQSKKYRLKGVEAYAAALRANPGYDEIYFNLGVTYAQLGEHDKAKRHLELALYINPLLRDAYASLGNLHVKLGNREKAMDIFEQAVGPFPDDKEIWLNLGFLYVELNKTKNDPELDEKAYEAFRTAFLLDPKFKQAYNNLTLICQKMGRKDPLLNIPTINSNIEAAIRRKDYKAALGNAEKLVKLLPKFADARVTLGNVLYYNDRREEAIDEMKLALEMDPSQATARLNLAKMYKVQGQFDLAREQAKILISQDPKNREAAVFMATLP